MKKTYAKMTTTGTMYGLTTCTKSGYFLTLFPKKIGRLFHCSPYFSITWHIQTATNRFYLGQ